MQSNVCDFVLLLNSICTVHICMSMQYARLLLKIISLNSALKIEFNQFIKFAIDCTSEFEFVMERIAMNKATTKKVFG